MGLLSCTVDETFIEVTFFQETSPAIKYSWLRPCITTHKPKENLVLITPAQMKQ